MPTVNGDGQLTPTPLGHGGLVRAGKLAALGELTPGVAHELNNPLFAILGLVELVVADVDPGSRTHRRLSVVLDTAAEMRAVLQALLAFAREAHGSPGVLDLREPVRQALELIRRTTPPRDVDLVERPAPEPMPVLGRRDELAQVVLHLLANAGAALPAGGTVVAQLERDGVWATLTVADSGPGVPPDVRERIFDPFFTTRRGSGLGLAAARAVAESHGGTLELAGADDGATFVLRLPLADDGTRS